MRRGTPKGFVAAVNRIKRAQVPLVLYWRHTLKGNARNVVLALPRAHRCPSAGIVVGRYSAGMFGTDKAMESQATRQLREDVDETERQFHGYTSNTKNI